MEREREGYLLLPVDTFLASVHGNLFQLLVHHLVCDLSGVHGKQLVLLLFIPALDLFKTTLIL